MFLRILKLLVTSTQCARVLLYLAIEKLYLQVENSQIRLQKDKTIATEYTLNRYIYMSTGFRTALCQELHSKACKIHLNAPHTVLPFAVQQVFPGL
jgi:hypothetical protein